MVGPGADQGLPLGERQPGRRDLVEVDLPGAPAMSSAAEARSQAWRVRVSDATALARPPSTCTSIGAHRRGEDAHVAPGAPPAIKEQPSDHRDEEAVSPSVGCSGTAVTVPDWGQSVSPPPTGLKRPDRRTQPGVSVEVLRTPTMLYRYVGPMMKSNSAITAGEAAAIEGRHAGADGVGGGRRGNPRDTPAAAIERNPVLGLAPPSYTKHKLLIIQVLS